MLQRMQRMLFGISPQETSFARRGFYSGNEQARAQLEQIGETFLHGYHTALEVADPELLADGLSSVTAVLRGFAYEGAAMALCLLDLLLPGRRNRLQTFCDGPAAHHIYMMHVGAGWAFARIPWRAQLPPAHRDPLLRWLTLDGYGFHEGYFHWQRYVRDGATPSGLCGYSLRAFDQGLGRSLWFVDGADAGRIAQTIASLSPDRHADLWSGVGLACAYAGGVDGSSLEILRESAGAHYPGLAQGVAFAAKTRQLAGNMADHTELACQILCGLSASDAARLPDVALKDLPPDDRLPSFEIWRRRIQDNFVQEEVQR